MSLSLQLLFHCAIVMLIGLLSGIPYGSAINKKREEEVVRAWRVAHSGLVMRGTMMIAITAVINQLDINAIALNILVWSSVIFGYGFCLALPYAAWVGRRGLAVGKTIQSNIVYTGNVVGAWGSLISAVALIFGCLGSMKIFS